MEYEAIRYEIDGPVLTLTLNRPEKLNAYTAQMGAELADALRRVNSHDDVRAVIITGEGRAFCAGADLSAGPGSFDTSEGGAGGRNFGDGSQSDGRGGSFVHAMFDCLKPIIVAFNGPAVGVGATLALPSDIRIAASTARFGFVFTRRGLAPEAGSAWFLPQLVGLPQALRWCLTGGMVSAEEAQRAGLVSEVTEPGDLLARARAIALEIAENAAPVSVAVTRQLLWRFAGAPDPFALLEIDGPFLRAMGALPDVREGVGAFLEKRPPHFPGRVSSDLPPGFPWWTGEG